MKSLLKNLDECQEKPILTPLIRSIDVGLLLKQKGETVQITKAEHSLRYQVKVLEPSNEPAWIPVSAPGRNPGSLLFSFCNGTMKPFLEILVGHFGLLNVR